MNPLMQMRGLIAVWIFTALTVSAALGSSLAYEPQDDPDECIQDLIGSQKISIAVVGSSLARFGLPPSGPELAGIAPPDAEGEARRLTRSGMEPEDLLRITKYVLEEEPDYLLIQVEPFLFQVAPPRRQAPLRAATRGLRDFLVDVLVPVVHPIFCEPLDQREAVDALGRVFDGEVAFDRGNYPIRLHQREYGSDLKQVVDAAHAAGTKIYLFSLPRSETGIDVLGEEREKQLADAVTKLSADSGLPLLQLGRALPDSNFFDHAHPNHAGREIIVRLLKDCLARVASSQNAGTAGTDAPLCGAQERG
jgi:hypothetical protein